MCRWHPVPTFLPAWPNPIWHPLMPPHSFPTRGLMPLSLCTHIDAPCTRYIRTGSLASRDELIGRASHSPISRASWPYLTPTLKIHLRFGCCCRILPDPTLLCLCHTMASSSSLFLYVVTVSSVPCNGSPRPSLHCSLALHSVGHPDLALHSGHSVGMRSDSLLKCCNHHHLLPESSRAHWPQPQ